MNNIINRRSGWGVVTQAAALVLLVTAAVEGTIIGEIVSAGFPSVRGLAEGRDLVRPGEWVPVIVRLTLENQDSFDGWLRISQPDKDGDLAFDRQRVHLGRDQTRRYWLYAVAGKPTGRPDFFSVEVFSDDNNRIDLVTRGERVRVILPPQPPDALTAEDYLVLSVGYSVGKVAVLGDPTKANKYCKTVHVAHMAPDELPTRWQGLQMVNAVVWDKADPTDLSTPQLDALLEWTRLGGVLVIAAGRSADAVAQKLSSVLPVELETTESTTALPDLRRRMLKLERDSQYSTPIVVAKCTTKKTATTIAREMGPDFQSTMVASRRMGMGRVVFVSAALSDLLVDEADSDAFFQRILELRDSVTEQRGYDLKNLVDDVNGWIGFKQIGATYLAVAMIFAALYVFAATLGSWQFLRTRGWLRHSWSAFAVVGMVASVVSVAGVQIVRGAGKKLVQMTIVDTEAGSSLARATAYFGLKTSLFGSLDVWLPNDYPQVTEPEPSGCVLHPFPPSSVALGTQYYADPGRYQMIPSRAELLGVPIRGTLKQFEGRWVGAMPGQLRANMKMTSPGPGGRYDIRVTPDSTIVNELGVDLYRTFLIYAAQDVFTTGAVTVEAFERADKVYFFPLGPIPSGQTIRPGTTLYADQAGNALEFEQWNVATLKTGLEKLAKGLGGLGLPDFSRAGRAWRDLERHEMSVLLMSMLEEYELIVEKPGSGPYRQPLSFTNGNGRHLDLSGLVDTRTALFIGFAHADGPVSLCTRSGGGKYSRVSPTDALTVYRVLIPLR